jgi:hypothetical protein
MGIPPLGDRDATGPGQRWTEKILVYGDDAAGWIKLTSEDGSITRTYRTITHDVARGVDQGLTIFKGLVGNFSDTLTLK